jgi:uncharacterized SAM-binding protein YcdF (DUF218 family)
MFIYLSKILPQLVMPIGLGVELLLIVIWLVRRGHRRAAQAGLLFAVLLLAVPATPRFSDALLRSLEDDYPVLSAAAAPAGDAVVILGGGTTARTPEQPEVDISASGGRLLYGFRLYRAGKAPRLILSGGSISGGEPEAEQMRQILSEWGVPGPALILETRSRNTYENAAETLALCRERGLRRLLLVTSAFHMRRAAAIFRKAAGPEIEILPLPTGRYVLGQRPFLLGEILPDAGALANTTLALRERIGIWVYRARGWL